MITQVPAYMMTHLLLAGSGSAAAAAAAFLNLGEVDLGVTTALGEASFFATGNSAFFTGVFFVGVFG